MNNKELFQNNIKILLNVLHYNPKSYTVGISKKYVQGYFLENLKILENWGERNKSD